MRYALYVLMLAVCMVPWQCVAATGQDDAAAVSTAKSGTDDETTTTTEKSEPSEKEKDTTTSTKSQTKEEDAGGRDGESPAEASGARGVSTEGKTVTDPQLTPDANIRAEHEPTPMKEVKHDSDDQHKGQTQPRQEASTHEDLIKAKDKEGQEGLRQIDASTANVITNVSPKNEKLPSSSSITSQITGPEQKHDVSPHHDSNDHTKALLGGKPKSEVAHRIPPLNNIQNQIENSPQKTYLRQKGLTTGKVTDTPTSTDIAESTENIDGITASTGIPASRVTTPNAKPTKDPSTSPESKVDPIPPMSTVSQALPLPHSVDKTDFSIGSSSLFALAALATLAVAAAAPAH